MQNNSQDVNPLLERDKKIENGMHTFRKPNQPTLHVN
jgi:hypothetical protein